VLDTEPLADGEGQCICGGEGLVGILLQECKGFSSSCLESGSTVVAGLAYTPLRNVVALAVPRAPRIST
jgi:hypothetical protein